MVIRDERRGSDDEGKYTIDVKQKSIDRSFPSISTEQPSVRTIGGVAFRNFQSVQPTITEASSKISPEKLPIITN